MGSLYRLEACAICNVVRLEFFSLVKEERRERPIIAAGDVPIYQTVCPICKTEMVAELDEFRKEEPSDGMDND